MERVRIRIVFDVEKRIIGVRSALRRRAFVRGVEESDMSIELAMTSVTSGVCH